MKNVLVIDDEVVRRELFKQIIPRNQPYNITLASTFEQAKSLLSSTYDVIFLDHDLGSSKPDETGYDLAKLIAAHNSSAVTIVVSLNPVGVKNILSVLPNSIPCPAYLVNERWDYIEKEFLNG